MQVQVQETIMFKVTKYIPHLEVDIEEEVKTILNGKSIASFL